MRELLFLTHEVAYTPVPVLRCGSARSNRPASPNSQGVGTIRIAGSCEEARESGPKGALLSACRLRLFFVTVPAGSGAGLLHGVARPAHPVGDILAKAGYTACPDLFFVALPAFAFHVALVGPVRKADAVLEREDCRAFICERGCR